MNMPPLPSKPLKLTIAYEDYLVGNLLA